LRNSCPDASSDETDHLDVQDTRERDAGRKTLAGEQLRAVELERFDPNQDFPSQRRGAHLLLQPRTRTLDGTLRPLFERWYPGLANDNVAGTRQAPAA
jgi:hypothetical protein